MTESEIVPNWHIFVSIFGRETEENVENYSQSGSYSSTITYLNFFLSATKMNFEKLPAGGGARDRIQKSPESECLCFHYRPRN